MRRWRQGCAATLPWFRATPFASAHHYRDRALPIALPGRAPHVDALVASLPTWDRTTFWVIDTRAATALRLAHALRLKRGLLVALAFNGWYDPDGALDGRAEIALLLALSERSGRTHGEAGLVCERERI